MTNVGSGEKKQRWHSLKGRKGQSSLLEGRGLGRLPMPRRAGKVEEAKPTSMADAQVTEASSSSHSSGSERRKAKVRRLPFQKLRPFGPFMKAK